MFQSAPRRPALLPALLFVTAALFSTHGISFAASLVLGLAALLGLARQGQRVRRFDVLLLVLACCAGLFSGWRGMETRVDALGNAALALPLGVACERPWNGELRASPKPVDPWTWRLRVDGLPEGEHPGSPDPIALDLDVRVRDRRDLGAFSGLTAGTALRFWARVRIDAEALSRARPMRVYGTIKSPKLIEPLDASSQRRMQRWRDRLDRRLRRIYAGDPRLSGFLAAVLLGQRSWKDPERAASLRASGLAHIVAISGLHTGLIAAFLFAVARRVFRRSFATALSMCALLAGFVWMTGAALPVQRAAGGASGFLIGRGLGREGEPLNRLACVAIALGIIAPGSIASPAYSLSFAAAAGILIALEDARRSRPSRVAAGVKVSLAAYLATAPLSAAYFGQVAPWAPLANLLALPFLSLVLVAGYVSLACAGVPLLGACSIAATRFGVAAIERVAEGFSRLPLSPWFVPEPGPWMAGLTAVTALAAFLAPPNRARRWLRGSWIIALVALQLGPPPENFERPGGALIDVGQGQALFWHDRGTTMLVDSAGRGYGHWDPGAAVLRPALLARGVRRIDRLVLSHGDADHAAGAFAVLDAFEVGELWLGPGWWRHPRLSDLAALAQTRGTGLRLVSRGDLSDGVTVLGPARGGADAKGNDGSVVLTLGRQPWTLFVPGDLDGPALRELLSRIAIPEVGAIVLAHHGSRSGTPAALLDRLDPRMALVSVGRRNRFGHPHEAIVERLRERRIPLWRTDHHGTIRLRAGPSGWRLTAEREPFGFSDQEPQRRPRKTERENERRHHGE